MSDVQTVSTTDEVVEKKASDVATAAKTEVVEDQSAPADKAGETAEDSETLEANEQETEGEEKKPGKKPGGFKKKIDKLRGKLTAKEAEISYWKEQALAKKPAEQQTQTETQTAKVDKNAKPLSENFETHEEWVEAVADWKIDQREAKAIQAKKESDLKDESTTKENNLKTKVQEFAKAHSDFNDLVEDVEDIPMSAAVQIGILESDDGPRLMYELCKNREEYARICELPYEKALKELGKFEARLGDASAQVPETKTTKAPPPLKPVGSRGAGTVKDLSQITDYDEYKAEMERQLRKK